MRKTLYSLILTHPHYDHTAGVAAVLAKYRVLNGVTNGMLTGKKVDAGYKALADKVAKSEQSARAADVMGLQSVLRADLSASGLTEKIIDPVKCRTIDPRITALWGQSEDKFGWSAKEFANPNNHSVVVRIDFGKASMLMSGDQQESSIKEMLAHYAGTSMLDVDVLQINHHGAANGTTDALLVATSPDYAVIQMGSSDRQYSKTAWDHGTFQRDGHA